MCQLAVKNTKTNILEIPTCIEWNTSSSLFSSYVSPIVKCFDVETKKVLFDLNFQHEKTLTFQQQQANSIKYNSDKSLLISAHENKQIKFFDVRSNPDGPNGLIKSIVGHTDSISSITFGINEYEIISGCHDGSIRYWDIRNYNLIHDVACHRKKYDEGVLALYSAKSLKTIFSAGSDGLIKGFKLAK